MSAVIVRDNGQTVTVRRDDGQEIDIPKGSPALQGIDSAIPVATSGQQDPQAFVNPSQMPSSVPSTSAASQGQQFAQQAPGLVSQLPPSSLQMTQGTSSPPPSGQLPGTPRSAPVATPGVSNKTPTYGEAAGMYRRADQNYNQGLNDLTTAQQKQNNAMSGALVQQDQAMDQREKSRQLFQGEIQAEKDKALEPYKAAIADFNSYKEDPDRWWKTRTGGQKAMAIASVFLAGMGNAKLMAAQALAGGVPQKQSNDAVTAIDKEIENDIDAQKLEYDKRGKNVALQGNLYAMNMARIGDKDKAFDLTTSMMQQSFARKLDIVARSTSNDQIAAQARMLGADFDQKSASGLGKIADDAADNAAKLAQIRAMHQKEAPPPKNEVPNVKVPVINPQTGKQVIDLQIVRDESGNPVAPTQMVDGRTHKPMFNPDGSPIYNEVETRNGEAKRSGAPDQYGVRTVVDPKTKQQRQVLVKATPAYEPFSARDEKEAISLGEAARKRDETLAYIDKLERDQSSFGYEAFGSTKNSQQYNIDRLNLISSWHGVIGINRWTDQIAKRIDSAVPNPGNHLFTAPGPEQYQSMRDSVNNDFNERMSEAGVPDGAKIGEEDVHASEPPSLIDKRKQGVVQEDRDAAAAGDNSPSSYQRLQQENSGGY